MGWASAVTAILVKDIRVDMRRRVEASSVLVFALAAGVLSSYIMGGVTGVSPSSLSVSVSLVMIFLSVYGSLAGFVREAEKGTLEGLRAAPVGPEALYAAKMLYIYILLVVSSLVYMVSLAVFGGAWSVLSASSLAATLTAALYLAAVSSFTSAVLVFSEARGVLMPVMILVLTLPYIQVAGPVLASVYSGSPGFTGVAALASGALVFSVVGLWLSRYVLEAE